MINFAGSRNEILMIWCFALIILRLIVHTSKCYVIILIDFGKGLHWHDTGTAAPTAACRFLS